MAALLKEVGMNSDIRLKCNFINHIKTKKLIKKLGYEGFYSLISLWCYAAQNKPKGVLDIPVEDIAIASNWSGDPEMFISALLQCGFLEKSNGGALVLHDWEEHNRHAYYAEDSCPLVKPHRNVDSPHFSCHKLPFLPVLLPYFLVLKIHYIDSYQKRKEGKKGK